MTYAPAPPWVAKVGLALARHIVAQFRQPDARLRIAGGAPVAAWGERAARADFGAIGKGGALELTHLEESVQEHLEPLLDRGQVVLGAFLGPDRVGPGAVLLVAPGMTAKKSY